MGMERLQERNWIGPFARDGSLRFSNRAADHFSLRDLPMLRKLSDSFAGALVQ